MSEQVQQVQRVVIGMDPHKRSVTIEVMTADESVVGGGRFDIRQVVSHLSPTLGVPDRSRWPSMTPFLPLGEAGWVGFRIGSVV